MGEWFLDAFSIAKAFILGHSQLIDFIAKMIAMIGALIGCAIKWFSYRTGEKKRKFDEDQTKFPERMKIITLIKDVHAQWWKTDRSSTQSLFDLRDRHRDLVWVAEQSRLYFGKKSQAFVEHFKLAIITVAWGPVEQANSDHPELVKAINFLIELNTLGVIMNKFTELGKFDNNQR